MPDELVVVTVLTPVSALVIVTLTPPTTAPVESSTVPLISPVLAFCPNAKPPIRITSINNPKRQLGRRPFVLIAQPPRNQLISGLKSRRAFFLKPEDRKSPRKKRSPTTRGADSMLEYRMSESDESRKETK